MKRGQKGAGPVTDSYCRDHHAAGRGLWLLPRQPGGWRTRIGINFLRVSVTVPLAALAAQRPNSLSLRPASLAPGHDFPSL